MKVLYICDRKKCERCHDECHLTTDVTHAEGFKEMYSGCYEEIQEYSMHAFNRLLETIREQAQEIKDLKEQIF